jgi:hypothetical protein
MLNNRFYIFITFSQSIAIYIMQYMISVLFLSNSTVFSCIYILRIWAINVIEVFSIKNFQEMLCVWFHESFPIFCYYGL